MEERCVCCGATGVILIEDTTVNVKKCKVCTETMPDCNKCKDFANCFPEEAGTEPDMKIFKGLRFICAEDKLEYAVVGKCGKSYILANKQPGNMNLFMLDISEIQDCIAKKRLFEIK